MTHTTSMGAEAGFGLFPAMRHKAPPRILSARPANLPLAVLRIDETNPSGKIEGGEVSLVQEKTKDDTAEAYWTKDDESLPLVGLQ